jgi:hypothetical protein
MNGSRKRSRNWVRMAPVLLDQPWPPDLHPARVPFKRHTLTVRSREDHQGVRANCCLATEWGDRSCDVVPGGFRAGLSGRGRFGVATLGQVRRCEGD